MWKIVQGTYFERVGRGVIPHGPGSVMEWTQAQAESYGLERLRKVPQLPVADTTEQPAQRGRPRKVKDADNAPTSKRD